MSRALGCTVNDVLMSTVAGALGASPARRGLRHRRARRSARFGAGEPALGRRADDARQQVRAAVRRAARRRTQPVAARLRDARHDGVLKGSQQPPMTLTVLGTAGLLPNAAGPRHRTVQPQGSLVASNVPGPQAPLYMCGQRIAEMHFWVPQSGSIGVGISILSYAGQGVLRADRGPSVHRRTAQASWTGSHRNSNGYCSPWPSARWPRRNALPELRNRRKARARVRKNTRSPSQAGINGRKYLAVV